MTIEQSVIKHYGREGLAEAILEGARARAERPDDLTVDDLSAFDEMHVGGRRATEHFIERLQLAAGAKVLDIGSGIGGAARYAAKHYAVHVTGIDLTPEYRAAAEMLSAAVGLGERTDFVMGSALDLPFTDGTFDAAYTVHAAMNIQNKEKLYQEAQRVLQPDGIFGIYDIMAGRDAAQMRFPVPWADDPNTSFLLTPRQVEDLLNKAGFDVLETENRHEFGLAALRRLLETGGGVISPQDRVHNLADNIEQGYCAPWQIICRKR